MSRGIDVSGDPLKRERLIDWYIEEKIQEFLQTSLIVKAIISTINPDQASMNSINTLLDQYRKSLFPTDKSNEELVEKYSEHLKNLDGQVLKVKSVER